MHAWEAEARSTAVNEQESYVGYGSHLYIRNQTTQDTAKQRSNCASNGESMLNGTRLRFTVGDDRYGVVAVVIGKRAYVYIQTPETMERFRFAIYFVCVWLAQ